MRAGRECLLHVSHNRRRRPKPLLQDTCMQLVGAGIQLEGVEGSVAFWQNSGSHGKKPLAQRSAEQSTTIAALSVHTIGTAEVYHCSRSIGQFEPGLAGDFLGQAQKTLHPVPRRSPLQRDLHQWPATACRQFRLFEARPAVHPEGVERCGFRALRFPSCVVTLSNDMRHRHPTRTKTIYLWALSERILRDFVPLHCHRICAVRKKPLECSCTRRVRPHLWRALWLF